MGLSSFIPDLPVLPISILHFIYKLHCFCSVFGSLLFIRALSKFDENAQESLKRIVFLKIVVG